MKNKMKLNLNNIVNNKYVLYLVAFVALVDIIGYLMRQEFSAVLFFYLVGMITYFYTKNMTIVLGSALVVTTLAHLIKNMVGIKEGLENESEEVVEDEVDEEVEEADLETEKVKNRLKTEEKNNKLKSKALNVPKKTKVSKDLEVDEVSKEKLDNLSHQAEELLNNFEKKGIKKETKSGYQNKQKLTPGLYNIPNKAQLDKQLGEADKIEAAYDNLEKVIGENGIKSMSNSTKELVRQQNELLKGLKDITPALHEAMGAIGKIDLGGLKQMFNSTTSTLSKE